MGVLNYKSSKQSGEYHFLVNYLAQNKEGIVMDVGANVGNYAKLLNSVNSKIEIYCFEPHPTTYKTLIENVVNLNIQSFNVGVGGENGALTLYDYEDRQGSEHASLYKEVIENIHGGKSTEHNVEMISLDSFATEKKISSVLKPASRKLSTKDCASFEDSDIQRSVKISISFLDGIAFDEDTKVR